MRITRKHIFFSTLTNIIYLHTFIYTPIHTYMLIKGYSNKQTKMTKELSMKGLKSQHNRNRISQIYDLSFYHVFHLCSLTNRQTDKINYTVRLFKPSVPVSLCSYLRNKQPRISTKGLKLQQIWSMIWQMFSTICPFCPFVSPLFTYWLTNGQN